MPKVNIIFFIANWVPNILLPNKFFEKSSIFLGGGGSETPFLDGHNCFEGKGPSRNKNQYNLFCRKWGFEYFSLFFEKTIFFLNNWNFNFFVRSGLKSGRVVTLECVILYKYLDRLSLWWKISPHRRLHTIWQGWCNTAYYNQTA